MIYHLRYFEQYGYIPWLYLSFYFFLIVLIVLAVVVNKIYKPKKEEVSPIIESLNEKLRKLESYSD